MNNKYEKIKKILTSQEKFHISLGLERIKQILKILHNPQEKLKIVQIAGTNGKGSTSRILVEILTQADYKTALYTSPHIHKYNERIKINGQSISDDDFLNYIENIDNIAKKNNIELTEFELLTAVAYCYFADEKVDIAIIETGLGGRFDATNVCDKNLFSIITSVSKDHTERLGKTIKKIAFEKAGIIKKGCPVIISKSNKGFSTIKEVAKEKKSNIINPSKRIKILFENAVNYVVIDGEKHEFSLYGLYQKENLKLVLSAVDLLNKYGFKAGKESVLKALKSAKWECRFEWHKNKNLVIDGAHNPSGTKKLRESLDFYFPNQKIIWIYGTLKNKNYIQNMKNLFKKGDEIYYFEFDERCLKYKEFKKYYSCGHNFLDNAHILKSTDLKVVAGSLYMPDYITSRGLLK